jgi:hypothetical protein
MDIYDVELETSEPDRICLTVPALPGLLILGRSVHEVLRHAELSIAFHTRDARVTAHGPRVQLRPMVRSG